MSSRRYDIEANKVHGAYNAMSEVLKRIHWMEDEKEAVSNIVRHIYLGLLSEQPDEENYQ